MNLLLLQLLQLKYLSFNHKYLATVKKIVICFVFNPKAASAPQWSEVVKLRNGEILTDKIA